MDFQESMFEEEIELPQNSKPVARAQKVVKKLDEKQWLSVIEGMGSMTAAMLRADAIFPIRTKDDKPSYRKNQREAIEAILKSYIINKKRFVVLNAPVGSGKSAINYTVGMIVGKALYITSQKMLQDQLVKDDFKFMSSIKGNGESACTHIFFKDDKLDVRSNNKLPIHKMCNTDKGSNKVEPSTINSRIAAKAVWTTGMKHKEFVKTNPTAPRLRYTSFDEAGVDSIQDELERIYKIDIDNTDYEEGCEPPTFSVWALKHILCNIKTQGVELVECPKRSATTRLRINSIRVLNPDVYHNHKETQAFPKDSKITIVDEAHGMEDAMLRIFTSTLPLAMFDSVTGSKLHALAKSSCTTTSSFKRFWTEHCAWQLSSIMSFANTMNSMSDVCKAIEDGTGMLITSNVGKIIYNAVLNSGNNSLSSALTDEKFFPYLDSINAEITKNNTITVDDFGEVISFSPTWYERELDIQGPGHIPKYTNRQRVFLMDMVQKVKQREIGSVTKAKDSAISHVWLDMSTDVEKVIDIGRFIERVDSEGRPQFLVRLNEDKYCGYSEDWNMTVSLDTDKNRPWFDLIPVNTASLMSRHFYGNYRLVLLSSGTWVSLRNQIRRLGVDLNNFDVVDVPTAFDVRHRPVILYDAVNFTAKSEDDNRTYLYTLQLGIDKWVYTIEKAISELRARYGGINIAIHTNSFAISKLVAENCKIDGRWIFHMNSTKNEIVNKHGTRVRVKNKDEALAWFYSHPDSGLTIVSPSIKEGVDFKRGICRAQIILKAPVPNWGDPYISTMSRGNPELGIVADGYFMNTKILVDTIQMYGRVVRAEDDWGITFILDSKLVGIIEECMRSKDYDIRYLKEAIPKQIIYSGVEVLKRWDGKSFDI